MSQALADQDDRDLIATALDATLVVEAAAGTGKTTELVRRIVRVIETGRAGVTEIVAVTFTEKAAGELKLRLREALEEARGRSAAGSDERGRLDQAVRRLEEAQVSTIHGFCADLLRERPVEARVDPLFSVLTETQAARMYDDSFHAWFQEQLVDPPEGIQRLLRRPSFGGFGTGADPDDGPIGRLRSAGWDLLQWRDFHGDWQRPPFDRAARIDDLVDQLHRFAEVSDKPAYANDNLHVDTRPARQLSEEIRRTETVAARDYNRCEAALIGLGRDRQFQRARKGSGKTYRSGLLREDVWHAREELQSALTRFEVGANADLAALLYHELHSCVDRHEAAKGKAGVLDFLDLLVKARDLITRDENVRRSFQQRFRRIFVDEFQDTDPLQAEILLLLAADDASVADWRRIRPLPGKLFLVGDPKQSIYRFRRADVGIYQSVYEMLERAGARRVTLSTSFRARPNIQRVINAAFEPAMTGDQHALQAGYVPLQPFRADGPTHPSVVVLPVPEPYATRNVANTAIEQSLPDAVGAFVHWLIHESGWMVAERVVMSGFSRTPGLPSHESPVVSGFSRTSEKEQLVPIQARHICLLFRRFVSYDDDMTRPYVEALEARGIPHLLVGGRSFHNRAEIEALRAALAAIEWPDDELSVFATLRGALFAIGDEELLEYRHHFKHFHPFRIPKEFQKVESESSSSVAESESSSDEQDSPPVVVSGFSRTEPPSDVLSGSSSAALAPGDESPVVSGFSRTDLARFAPIIDALRLLQALHRARNHAPVASTISRLLEATRAHVRFALEHGGEQVLANVLHVAELARRYEAEGGISFRGFIDELREQAASGEAGEAPILEEGSDGVRLMTVHKAKGLEFPIVILADMTARLRASVASRYIDPARRMCAIRLAGCSPSDLVQHEAEELLREQAEGVRVAYVAATRARDLLVIPAVGDEARDGWIEPLNAAIYPPLETRRRQIAAPACPTFRTKDSVLTRPNGDPAGPETVCPGLHVFGSIGAEGSGRATSVPITGSTARSHRVVWWDPRALNLNVEPPLGIRHPELIVRDVAPEIVESGMAEYNLWRESRQAAAAAGAQPSISVRTVTDWARTGSGLQSGLKLPPVEVIDLPRAANRPSGRRFGTLVHAVLASVPLDADRDVIKCLTSSQGGTLGAPEEEMDAAVEIVQTVLAHPVLDHARKADKKGGCRREVPITWRDTDGVLIEGVIDLVFEQADGWTAIDFKTDEEFRGNSTVYRRQIGMYASAIQAGVSGRVSAVLMRV